MFKIFKRLTTKELIMIVLVVIFVCLNVYLNLKIPDYMSDITTLLSTKGTKDTNIGHEGYHITNRQATINNFDSTYKTDHDITKVPNENHKWHHNT